MPRISPFLTRYQKMKSTPSLYVDARASNDGGTFAGAGIGAL